MLTKPNINAKKLAITKQFVLLVFLFASIIQGFSQKNYLELELKVTVHKGNYEGVRVAITKDGNAYKSINYESKYSINLDLGHEYVFTATKKGYVTKSLTVDTNVPEENLQDEFAIIDAKILLEPQPEDLEITYTQSVGLFYFSSSVGDFIKEKNYDAKSRDKEKSANADTRKKQNTEKGQGKINSEVTQPKVAKDIVERVVFQDKVKITYRTVTINGTQFEYRKEEYSWGGVYFYNNNKNITEALYEKDTTN